MMTEQEQWAEKHAASYERLADDFAGFISGWVKKADYAQCVVIVAKIELLRSLAQDLRGPYNRRTERERYAKDTQEV